MKPKRVKKEKYKFTAMVELELFMEANKARISFNETWVEVLERAMRELIERRVK